MNTWCQVDVSFRTHRKTKRLTRELGKDCARWLPIWLWLYCIESARDGDLSSLTDQDLADVLDYDGDASKLRAALIDAGFLSPGGHVVGWQERYADKFAFYERRAKIAAAARWGKTKAIDAPSHSSIEIRGDKIRGEEISKHGQASLLNASSTAAAAPSPETVPRRTAGAAPAPLSDADWLTVLKSSAAYAGINVANEFEKMRIWCDANKKQSTRRRFVNWLNRCEKPLSVGKTSTRSQEEKAHGYKW